MHQIRTTLHCAFPLLALLSACGEAAVGPQTPVEAATVSAPLMPEFAALDELTRSLALAMNNAELRQRIKADLRASRFTVEHKLLLRDYLLSDRGGMVLAGMARATGRSRDDILASLTRVRPLELYMPVDAHRERWTGGSDLWVGSLLEDHTLPLVYDLAGNRVDLPANAEPARPTLALVPVESDFSRPLDARSYRNAADRGGEAIGTLVASPGTAGIRPALAPSGEQVCADPFAIECSPETGGGGTMAAPHGLYYVGASLLGVGEGGLKGKPEIEVHVIRSYDPTMTSASAEPPFPSCRAGETRSGYRYFNQDAEQWVGRALVLDTMELTPFRADPVTGSTTRAFTVQLWEDDTEPCQLRTDIDLDHEFSQLLGGGFFIWTTTTPATGDSFAPGSWPVRLGTATLGAWLLSHGWNFVSTNDEFLGTAVERSSVQNAGYDGYSHILIRQNETRNGAIKLEIR